MILTKFTGAVVCESGIGHITTYAADIENSSAYSLGIPFSECFDGLEYPSTSSPRKTSHVLPPS